jgi:Ras-related GTP-binding protein A/B
MSSVRSPHPGRSSNNPASLTTRLGATIDVEQNHVRFLGDLILNLWDCGGQDAFMDSYLTTQRSTIFQHVGVMIYVFDVESREVAKDLEYYKDCLNGLGTYSPGATVFLLIHKMDLVRGPKHVTFDRKKEELAASSGAVDIVMFGTSIYDESLYKVHLSFQCFTCMHRILIGCLQAWSSIVHTLIPNAAILSKHLTTFAEACSATEVVLFERTTFLVIATSTTKAASEQDLSSTRYERTSELIKAFKYSCSRVREEFNSLELEFDEFTAVLDEMTRNTYVLVIVHDPIVGTSRTSLMVVMLTMVQRQPP